MAPSSQKQNLPRAARHRPNHQAPLHTFLVVRAYETVSIYFSPPNPASLALLPFQLLRRQPPKHPPSLPRTGSTGNSSSRTGSTGNSTVEAQVTVVVRNPNTQGHPPKRARSSTSKLYHSTHHTWLTSGVNISLTTNKYLFVRPHEPRRHVQLPRWPLHEHHLERLTLPAYAYHAQYRSVLERVPPRLRQLFAMVWTSVFP